MNFLLHPICPSGLQVNASLLLCYVSQSLIYLYNIYKFLFVAVKFKLKNIINSKSNRIVFYVYKIFK